MTLLDVETHVVVASSVRSFINQSPAQRRTAKNEILFWICDAKNCEFTQKYQYYRQSTVSLSLSDQLTVPIDIIVTENFQKLLLGSETNYTYHQKNREVTVTLLQLNLIKILNYWTLKLSNISPEKTPQMPKIDNLLSSTYQKSN